MGNTITFYCIPTAQILTVGKCKKNLCKIVIAFRICFKVPKKIAYIQAR